MAVQLRSRLEIAERDAAIRASTASTTDLARRYGLSAPHVARIRQGSPRALTPRERFEQVAGGAWRAECMTDEEWGHWLAMNPLLRFDDLADRPCVDCPLGFAAEMRSQGKCNGTPGWVHPAEDIEEAEMGDTVTVSNVRIEAPCERCIHREVCRIRATLPALEGGVEVAMPKPDGALTVTVAARIECSQFKPEKGTRSGRTINLSDEERQRRSERRIQANAERAASRARVPA